MADFLSDPKKLWDWIVSVKDWNTPEGWTVIILIVFIILVGLVWFIRFSVEAYLRIDKALRAIVRRYTLPATVKLEIRLRQQFCRVLRSDIEVLNKTENWNDQFFTDLEAEVEAEGGFYASPTDRLLRRQSTGLRRVGSLIRAIESSTELSLLLVGEPGSGKSVALRHLAIQIAEKGIRSRDPEARVPLYINLKELPPAPPGGPTADFIKTFVLDNIRRGDADTADYVHDHWAVYRERGVWFFLFDSFDEIPAVMHAPRGSPVIQEHAEAIRQFLGSRSDCRGVLASREFKGPDALPWQKFRILPLSQKRQDALISNSTLLPDDMRRVRRHLADGSMSLRHNPLFLTLLCRFVRQEKRLPANDYDLLERHVLQLAGRDAAHTQGQYKLLPQQLVEGATRLAVLFAENAKLSLAPTYDQIRQELPVNDPMGPDLESLLQALAYVKIGRTDVREANIGDRRFTFSHRRYQETLFVRYLAQHFTHIAPQQMLTDLRWREYAVTLLQSQSVAVIQPYCDAAAALLNDYARTQTPSPILPEYGGHLGYYEWENVEAVALLRLLQEGLARRRADAPRGLTEAVEALLGPRWSQGDAYDRARVLEVGGLLPLATLQGWLTAAVETGDAELQSAAFSQISLLPAMPTSLATWVCARLSDEVLRAQSSVELLRLEALSARLPESVGSSFVFRRSQAIQSILHTLLRVMHSLNSLFEFLFSTVVHNSKRKARGLNPSRVSRIIFTAAVEVVALLFFNAILGFVTALGSDNVAMKLFWTVFTIIFFLVGMRYTWLLAFRKLGAKVTWTSLIKMGQTLTMPYRLLYALMVPYRSTKAKRTLYVLLFLAPLLLGACLYFTAYGTGMVDLTWWQFTEFLVITSIVSLGFWMVLRVATEVVRELSQARRLRRRPIISSNSTIPIRAA